MGIQAAEISAILKEQIKNFGKDAEVAEVGQVLSVGDGIARTQQQGERDGGVQQIWLDVFHGCPDWRDDRNGRKDGCTGVGGGFRPLNPCFSPAFPPHAAAGAACSSSSW